MEKITVFVSDDKIKSLPSGDGVVLIPSPGTHKAIVFMFAVLDSDFSVAYTNVNVDASLRVSGVGGSFDVSNGCIPSLFEIAGRVVTTLYPRQYADGTSPVTSSGYGLSTSPGYGLYLVADNGNDGDFTGGDESNRVIVTIFYEVIDLP